MKWITREKIKVDRVACPWVIRHFVDPAAEFLFLPHDTDWSKIDNRVVFDVPNCELGHNGEDISFKTKKKKYRLSDPALYWRDRARGGFASKKAAFRGRRVALDRAWFQRARIDRPRNSRTRICVYDALYQECKKRAANANTSGRTASLFEIVSTVR